MSAAVTDEQIQQLAATAKPFALALLWWDSERHQDGAAAIELEHQRRMVSLHADGTIAVLCPGGSDILAGVAVMTVSPEQAETLMADDPAVQAGMIRCEVHPGNGFPGDTIPG
jgi:hypothetical protein